MSQWGWLVSVPAESWDHLDISSLMCLVTELGWLQSWIQLGLSTRVCTYGLSMWFEFLAVQQLGCKMESLRMHVLRELGELGVGSHKAWLPLHSIGWRSHKSSFNEWGTLTPPLKGVMSRVGGHFLKTITHTMHELEMPASCLTAGIVRIGMHAGCTLELILKGTPPSPSSVSGTNSFISEF